MQKEFIKIKLRFDKGEEQFNVFCFPLKETVVAVKPIVEDLNDGCLIIRRHNYVQTQYTMTGAGPCFLMLFDEHGKYVSSRMHSGDSKAPFFSFISDKYVLILPVSMMSNDLHVKQLVLT